MFAATSLSAPVETAVARTREENSPERSMVPLPCSIHAATNGRVAKLNRCATTPLASPAMGPSKYESRRRALTGRKYGYRARSRVVAS